MDTMVWDLLKEIRLHDGLSCDLPIPDDYRETIVGILVSGFDHYREVWASDIMGLIGAVRKHEGIQLGLPISDGLLFGLEVLLDQAYAAEEDIRS